MNTIIIISGAETEGMNMKDVLPELTLDDLSEDIDMSLVDDGPILD